MPKQSNRSASTDATLTQRSDDDAACDLLTHAIEGSAGSGLAEVEVALACMSALVGEARGILADRDRLAAEVARLMHERGYACEEPCGDCAGCQLADQDHRGAADS